MHRFYVASDKATELAWNTAKSELLESEWSVVDGICHIFFSFEVLFDDIGTAEKQ